MGRGIFFGVLIGLLGAWADSHAQIGIAKNSYYISYYCVNNKTCVGRSGPPYLASKVEACQAADSWSDYTFSHVEESYGVIYCRSTAGPSFAHVAAATVCPDGFVESFGKCYCANGGDYTAGQCVCPDGKELVGGECVDECAAGTHREGEECVSDCPDRGWSSATFATGVPVGAYAPDTLRCFGGCVWQCRGGVVVTGSPHNSYAAACKSVPGSACDGSEEGDPSEEEHPGEEVPEEPGPGDEPFEGPCPAGMVPEYNPVTSTLGCGYPVQACPGGTSKNPVTGHCTCREDGTGATGCAGNTGQREETQTTVTNPDGSTTTTREVWSDGVFKGTETIQKDANGNITGRAATGQLGSEEEGGSSARAGDCSAGFQCKGDAVQCAQLRVAWEQKCLMEYHEGEANEAEDLREKETLDVGGFDSYGDLFGSGVCPSGVSVSLPGAGNVTADVGAFCELAELMRPFVILSALVFGMVYAFRGGGF